MMVVKEEAVLSEDECEPLTHSPGIATSRSRESLVPELCPLVTRSEMYPRGNNVVGSPRGVDVNRTGRPDLVQVQLLSAGRTGIQDRLSRWKVLQPRQGCDCPQTVLSKEEGPSPSETGDQPHLPLDCCQPALPGFHGDVAALKLCPSGKFGSRTDVRPRKFPETP